MDWGEIQKQRGKRKILGHCVSLPRVSLRDSAMSKRVRVRMTAERVVHLLFRNFGLSGLSER
jgi:hypothetical protein